MSQTVFERYEKKYILTSAQYKELREHLNEFMQIDEYGLHTISNIYFDTDTFELIRASIERPIYKEKFRLRSYGIPGQNDAVFLELKKKYKGVVYKRRVSMTLQQAMGYLENRNYAEEKTQILTEIDWFFKIYDPVPKVYIAYDRIALFGKEDSNLRITFDSNIRWRDHDLDLSKGDYGDAIMNPNCFLMEIKIPGAMPLWLSHLLTKLKIYSNSFSKYGTCYQKKILGHTIGGQNIA